MMSEQGMTMCLGKSEDLQKFFDVIAASCLIPGRIRCWLYRLYGMDVNSTAISCRCYFGSNNVLIGRDVFINHSCCFHNPGGRIAIGDNTWIAMHVIFTTSTHEMGGVIRGRVK